MEFSQAIVRASTAAAASGTGGLWGGGAAIIANQLESATVESGGTATAIGSNAIAIGSNAIAKATEKGGFALAISLPNDNVCKVLVGVAVGSFIGYFGYTYLVDCFQKHQAAPNDR